MLFSSITFLIFFLPAVLLVYYCCPSTKAKNYFFLFASLIFYAWGEPIYVLIMMFSIAMNYGMGLLIGDTSPKDTRKRKIFLALAIAMNLSLLIFFKYLGFFEETFNMVLRITGQPHIKIPVADIALPIGISFYTFQSISYLVDIYKNPSYVQRNILNLGLYISLFPALIAGPIVRYHDISEAIVNRKHSADLFAQGVERFIVGLAKKVLIANTMAETADSILSFSPDLVSAPYLFLGILSYMLQIYYDFSGYSDMAIGLGKMFGFNILENFNYPYMSKSITEFWRRWHISLSSWFKDYLYIPLGGNRKGKVRTYVNLYIVFFITGLWHGAAFNFIVWGLGHGTLLVIEKKFSKPIGTFLKDGFIKSTLSHIYAVCAVMLLWVFFRLDIADSLNFVKNLFTINEGNKAVVSCIKLSLDLQFYIILFFALLFAFPWWRKFNLLSSAYLLPIRQMALITLLILSICMLANNAYNPFIYFRF